MTIQDFMKLIEDNKISPDTEICVREVQGDQNGIIYFDRPIVDMIHKLHPIEIVKSHQIILKTE